MVSENGRDRFKDAIGILADEKGRIKERLLVAYASQLSRINPVEDLPDDLASDFAEIRFGISDAEVPYGYGEHASEKIEGMTEEEATAHAKKIYTMFLKIFALAPLHTN